MDHRWIARIAVAALHLGLLAALWRHQPPQLTTHNEQRLTIVRIVQVPQRPPPLASPQAAARAARHAPAAPEPPTPELPTRSPPAFSTEAAPPGPLVAAPDATPAEPPRTTLRLALPPGYAASTAAARNPALSDERSNTRRPSFEDKIADAAGATGEWVSERTSDSRTLMRRGDTCVEVLRSRIADTDPFNSSVAPRTVPMFGKPYKCK